MSSLTEVPLLLTGVREQDPMMLLKKQLSWLFHSEFDNIITNFILQSKKIVLLTWSTMYTSNYARLQIGTLWHSAQNSWILLRILAMYEAKTAKNSNFWMFWSITLLIFFISWIIGQNVQKLQILLFLASYIASILNCLLINRHILTYMCHSL